MVFEILGEIKNSFELLMLGFKIVLMIFLIGWVRGHLGGGLIAAVVILILGYFVIFEYFIIFGPMFLFYLIIIIGGGVVVQDLAFGKEHYTKGGNDYSEGYPHP
ncbi:hypothetical protein K8R43_04070 [archaeon]|nr:hypothetical protein [archaeon]